MNNIYFTDDKLVETSQFEYGKYQFKHFNPVQSKVYEFHKSDVNILVSSHTASGKTICGEMFIANTVRKNRKKSLYLTPIKALAQEKYDDWSNNHHFSDLNISLCTGDNRITSNRADELDCSDIIIMTAESLNSRARNHRSNTSQFLKQVETVVIDESHMLKYEGRGDHLEIAIAKMCRINKNIRFVLLSATLDNVEDVAQWISRITNKDTPIIKSDYRPCKLNIHYPSYKHCGYSYDKNEEYKVIRAMQIVESYKDDKIIIFVHSKKTGAKMIQNLKAKGFECAFHNGDLPKEERLDIENRFKNDPDFKMLVATSTISAGINLPARRVIVLGVHRGKNLIPPEDIKQMLGRVGRKQDSEGDSYLLLPDVSSLKEKERLKEKILIKSQLVGGNKLAFHIVSEIFYGELTNLNEIEGWYKDTFAYFQNGSKGIDDCYHAIDMLLQYGCIKINDKNGLEATQVGSISSMFYFCPFDVATLLSNFNKVFKQNKYSIDDIAFAFGCTPEFKMENINSDDRESVLKWYETRKTIHMMFSRTTDSKYTGDIKASYAFYKLFTASMNTKDNITTMAINLKNDFDRRLSVVESLDSMVSKWDKKQLWKDIKAIVSYGVEEKYVDLVKIPNIGKVKAQKLYASGLKTSKDVSQNIEKVMIALNCKKPTAEKICKDASEILSELTI